jgi:DNA-binding IclR family transcriptional regulator
MDENAIADRNDDPQIRREQIRREIVERPGMRRNMSTSATRALDVLNYIAELGRPARSIEIATAIDLHPSSANQLLKTMADVGYLTFDPRLKLYCPSARLARFSSWLDNLYYGQDRLASALDRLADESASLVLASNESGLHAQVVTSVAPATWTQPVPNGTKLLLVGSTIGKALLMNRPDAEVRWIAEESGLTKDEKAALAGELKYFRDHGAAVGSFDGNDAILTIAIEMPPLAIGHLVVSISREAAFIRDHEERLTAALHRCMEDLCAR